MEHRNAAPAREPYEARGRGDLHAVRSVYHVRGGKASEVWFDPDDQGGDEGLWAS